MATREEILKRIKEILVGNLGIVGRDKITEDASFEKDLGADSLDRVELVMELEDQFGIKISDEDARKLLTVGLAVDYIFEHQPA